MKRINHHGVKTISRFLRMLAASYRPQIKLAILRSVIVGRPKMTSDEHPLLLESAKNLVQLFQDRDDIVVGITAVLLDLYRINFREGVDSKQHAIARLKLQRDILEENEPRKMGILFLESLMLTLNANHLDAAKLLRKPVAGSVSLDDG
jgi:hypothetical protein